MVLGIGLPYLFGYWVSLPFWFWVLGSPTFWGSGYWVPLPFWILGATYSCAVLCLSSWLAGTARQGRKQNRDRRHRKTLRVLNVQRPWARLLLTGAKQVEVCKYPLKNIQMPQPGDTMDHRRAWCMLKAGCTKIRVKMFRLHFVYFRIHFIYVCTVSILAQGSSVLPG